MARPRGVLGSLLGRASNREQRVLAHVLLARAHGNHLRLPRGERARLVKTHAPDLRQALERVPLAHQKAVPGGIADRRHDGCGRGEHERTRAEDNEDGDRADDLVRHEIGENCCHKGDDDDPHRPAVGEVHDLGLAGVGRLHEANHPPDGRVLAHACRGHVERAELVDRAGRHLVPRALVHRQALAGHDRLVDRGLTGDDDAIYGHGLPGQHA